MLAVEKKPIVRKMTVEELKKAYEPKDTIVNKVFYTEEVAKDGSQVRRRTVKKVNLTKVAKETKKALKAETAVEKIIAQQKEMIKKGVL